MPRPDKPHGNPHGGGTTPVALRGSVLGRMGLRVGLTGIAPGPAPGPGPGQRGDVPRKQAMQRRILPRWL
jgi:hypothetical protein